MIIYDWNPQFAEQETYSPSVLMSAASCIDPKRNEATPSEGLFYALPHSLPYKWTLVSVRFNEFKVKHKLNFAEFWKHVVVRTYVASLNLNSVQRDRTRLMFKDVWVGMPHGYVSYEQGVYKVFMETAFPVELKYVSRRFSIKKAKPVYDESLAVDDVQMDFLKHYDKE